MSGNSKERRRLNRLTNGLLPRLNELEEEVEYLREDTAYLERGIHQFSAGGWSVFWRWLWSGFSWK